MQFADQELSALANNAKPRGRRRRRPQCPRQFCSSVCCRSPSSAIVNLPTCTRIMPLSSLSSASASLPLLLVTFAFSASLLNLITLSTQLVSANINVLAPNQQSPSSSSPSQQLQQQQLLLQQNNPVIHQHHQQTLTTTTTTTTITTPSGKARYKTAYACEDRQLTMDCEFGSKINLIRANFGRFSITQCNEQGQLDLSTDCITPITFRIMQDRCQDKQKCSVNATSVIFGDRCPQTRKYLEVHFQCQLDSRSPLLNSFDTPDRVDLREAKNFTSTSSMIPNQAQILPSGTGGSSPVLPPNNPSNTNGFSNTNNNLQRHQFPSQASFQQQSNNDVARLSHSRASGHPLQQQQQPQLDEGGQQQPATVMNSEIISYMMANNVDKIQAPGNREPTFVTLRHTVIENMSNPRCVSWDPAARQWTYNGGKIIETNSTHTTCAFDHQTSSYMLVMDYYSPTKTISASPPAHQIQPQPMQNDFGSPYPNILEAQPVPIDSVGSQAAAAPDLSAATTSTTKTDQQLVQLQQAQQPQGGFSSLVSYLLGFLSVAVVLMILAFIASTMRSSASTALKSLGNFSAFGGPKYKAGRRHHDNGGPPTLHPNKDLLVINNQDGHQFLYAPASTTKISNSSSTHILSASGNPSTLVGGHHLNQGTMHRVRQQQLYSGGGIGGGTLSNLSAAGTPSNNYYYGLMGLTSPYPQQQQQHHFSRNHLNQQQIVQSAASYNHQANKSTMSTESANSSSSSSGVESGSTSMQQQQQQRTQPQAQQACLVTMNNDYNLIGQHLLNGGGGYGQHQPQQQHIFNSPQNFGAGHPQPTLTWNAHYSTSGPAGQMNLNAASGPQQMLHNRQLSNAMREHIYECVDDDRPNMARLLMPMNNSNGNTANDHQQQFGTLGNNQVVQMQIATKLRAKTQLDWPAADGSMIKRKAAPATAK